MPPQFRKPPPIPDAGFHNPYNFVPFHAPSEGDGDPLGQHRPKPFTRYHADCVSGRIAITVETATPLLLPDAAAAERVADADERHRAYPARLDPVGGRPYLPPTTLKGALRVAYEAVTNSRLGAFDRARYEAPLPFRRPPQAALGLQPVRVQAPATLDVLPVAAWLGCYRGRPTTYTGKAVPVHGDPVVALIEEWEAWTEEPKHRPCGQGGPGTCRFSYDKVVALERLCVPGSDSQTVVADPAAYEKQLNGLLPLRPGARRMVGWVHRTNQSAPRKHDERVFGVLDNSTPQRVSLGEAEWDSLRARWRTLIESYRAEAEDVIARRAARDRSAAHDDYLPAQGPGKPAMPALSPAAYEDWWRELKPGMTGYALIDGAGRILDLFPVSITRELTRLCPADLLPQGLTPPASAEAASPADRLFGALLARAGDGEEASGSLRGRLRFSALRCDQDGDEAIQTFASPEPLAILAQPKAQQSRFYGAMDRWGNPYPHHSERKDHAAKDRQGLRGRKVYPHQRHVQAYAWDPERFEWHQDVPFVGDDPVEWRRPRNGGQERRDKQNRSVRSWVRRHVSFRGVIHVHDAERADLGALLWLLSLPKRHFHRLGGGKPLGFGSVRITIDEEHTSLSSGGELQRALRELERPGNDVQAAELVAEFQDSVTRHDAFESATFDQVPRIATFLQCARGYQRSPVHYPRRDRVPDAEGKQYEWNRENERYEQHPEPRHPNGYTLPPLGDDDSLPYL